MKMPRRNYFPTFAKDCFGLDPLPSPLEPTEETYKRVATVKKCIEELFAAAANHLGEDEARHLFLAVSRRRKRGKGKTHAMDRDARLLAAHDEAKQRGEPVAVLARRLHKRKLKLGSTAEAIEAQIRKLVKERADREKAAAKERRRRRMSICHENPTLLETVGSEK